MIFGAGMAAGLLLGLLIAWGAARFWTPPPRFSLVLRNLQGQGRDSLTEQRLEQLESELERLSALLDNDRLAGGAWGAAAATPELPGDVERHELTGSLRGSKSLRQQVCALKEQGLPAEEIARRLGTGRGEIELILNLLPVSAGQER